MVEVNSTDWQEADITITVKAYPAVSTKYRETVCVAGIREGLLGSAQHIRLYPVPFRDLPFEQRFKKWDRIRVKVRKAKNDSRPESFTPDMGSISMGGHLDTKKKWQARRSVVDQLPRYSMCALQALQAEQGTSLGLVAPSEVLDFTATTRERDEREEARRYLASQPTLFDIDKKDLPLVEAIPFSFRYVYRCEDCKPGKLHRQSIIDWEINQAYRRWRDEYGADQVIDRLRSKWLGELCGPEKDTMFFSGNMHQHPGSFLILGTWWPPH